MKQLPSSDYGEKVEQYPDYKRNKIATNTEKADSIIISIRESSLKDGDKKDLLFDLKAKLEKELLNY